MCGHTTQARVGSTTWERRSMAPYNKPVTLRDVEGGTTIGTTTVGTTEWQLNFGVLFGLLIVANIVHPPALVMLALNAVLLAYNVVAVQKAGKDNTPSWVLIIIAIQFLIVLQYGWVLVNTLF